PVVRLAERNSNTIFCAFKNMGYIRKDYYFINSYEKGRKWASSWLEVIKKGRLNGITMRLRSEEAALYRFLDFSSFTKISEARLPCPLSLKLRGGKDNWNQLSPIKRQHDGNLITVL
ncbi:MAG: hypothetical protein R3339_05255, partial [Thermodesulfobacteriota bacterium]|nr:hypothetical protein [Thermodesulfobacteriota bacterium]